MKCFIQKWRCFNKQIHSFWRHFFLWCSSHLAQVLDALCDVVKLHFLHEEQTCDLAWKLRKDGRVRLEGFCWIEGMIEGIKLSRSMVNDAPKPVQPCIVHLQAGNRILICHHFIVQRFSGQWIYLEGKIKDFLWTKLTLELEKLDSCKPLNFSPPNLAASCFFPFLFTTYICESAMGWDERLIHLGGNQSDVSGYLGQRWDKRFIKTTMRNPMSTSMTFENPFWFYSSYAGGCFFLLIMWFSKVQDCSKEDQRIASRREKETPKSSNIFSPWTLPYKTWSRIKVQNAHKATCVTKIGSYS